MIPPLFGKQEVGIWWVKNRFPQYGIPIWSLWPNITFLSSIVAEKNATKNVHIYKCMSNVYKNQQNRQTGSRNLMGPKMLPTIWSTYMKVVTKYQISAINSGWEKCDEKCLGQMDRGKTVYPPPPSGSGRIIIQNVLERKDSMAVLPIGFGKSMCYVPPFCFWTRYYIVFSYGYL